MDQFDLTARVAVVTGAGNGLGNATAIALAACGASVECADVDKAAAVDTASAIVDAGGVATGVSLDVRNRSEVEALAEDVHQRHGRLDIWVNVAGIMRLASVLDLDEQELDDVLAVNLKGVLFGSAAAARRMVAQGRGSIINVASAIIDGPQPRMAAYGMSKAAVSHMSRTMALEVGKRGVRVNVVAPGWTRTPMTTEPFTGADGDVDESGVEETAQLQARFTPLRRAAEPSDTAAAVVFLASDSAAFVTGQTLRPHGGITVPW